MTQRLLEEVCSASRSSSRPRVCLSPAATAAARAPGCVRVCRGPPRAFLGREESVAGALLEQLAERGPARSAGSWGRSLARLPPRSQLLAFCAATLPEPFGELRRPRSRPAPLPRESLRPRFGPGRGDSACCRLTWETQPLGDPVAVASPKEGGSARAMPNRPGLVSALRPCAGGRAGALGQGEDSRPQDFGRQTKACEKGKRSSFHPSPTGTG